MATYGYGKYITEHIQGLPVSEPITTMFVADTLAAAFGIDIKNAKKVTNVNMKRLTNRGDLVHIKKGVYGKIKNTPFGKLKPNADDIISKVLLHDGNNTIGYIAGPTLLNAVGLCSWMPKERHIVTNRYRSKIPANTKIRMHKPIVTINDKNAIYFQTLEMFSAVEQYPIDAENPDEILRVSILRSHIDKDKLVLYALKYCRKKVLFKTMDVVLGGIEL